MELKTSARAAVVTPSGTVIEQVGSASMQRSVVTGLASIAALIVWANAATAWLGAETFEPAKLTSPVEGLTIFAVFFVAATAIERLLEPVARLFGNGPKMAANEADQKAKASAATMAPAEADPSRLEAKATQAEAAVSEAAEAKAAAAVAAGNRSVVLWAVASALGIYLSASSDMYLLSGVGIARPTHVQEVLFTGLIIGGGTKPLHELVELISAKKEAAKAATG